MSLYIFFLFFFFNHRVLKKKWFSCLYNQDQNTILLTYLQFNIFAERYHAIDCYAVD
jgi:hypothetical protein